MWWPWLWFSRLSIKWRLWQLYAGPYQIANFISLDCSKDRKQVSLHATQTGQIDGKVLGFTQEQGSMRSHLETGKGPRCMNTQNLSALFLKSKSGPSNFQHNPGFMMSTKKLTKNSSSLMFEKLPNVHLMLPTCSTTLSSDVRCMLHICIKLFPSCLSFFSP